MSTPIHEPVPEIMTDAPRRRPTAAGLANLRTGSSKGRKVACQLLRDMRHVYEHPEEKDATPGQRLCRQLLKKSPDKFLAQLGKLEAEHRGAAKETAAEPEKHDDPVEMDAGTERVIELIDRLLDEWDATQAAACPTCGRGAAVPRPPG